MKPEQFTEALPLNLRVVGAEIWKAHRLVQGRSPDEVIFDLAQFLFSATAALASVDRPIALGDPFSPQTAASGLLGHRFGNGCSVAICADAYADWARHRCPDSAGSPGGV